MKARILSKERVYFEGEIKSALLPTKEGQIEILENHAPIFALLKEGKIKIQTPKFKKRIFAKSGIIKFFNNNLLILIK
ncbi:hypothetical protein J7J24_00795 [bacterium]|nr:hypothetical protein [bacterium]